MTTRKIEKAIDGTGWGAYSRLQIAILVLCGIAEALSMVLIPVTYPLSACDLDAELPQVLQLNMIVSLGMAIGSVVWGLAFDVFGRDWAIAMSMVTIFASTLSCSLSEHMMSHMFCAAILGAGISGLQMSSRINLMENLPMAVRGKYGLCIDFAFAMTYSFCIGMSMLDFFRVATTGPPYAFRVMSWRVHYGVVAFFNMLVGCFTVLLSGNPRWLYSKGAVTEATTALQRTFAINMSKPTDLYPDPGLDSTRNEIHAAKRFKKIFQYAMMYRKSLMISFAMSMLLFPNVLVLHFWLHALSLNNNTNTPTNGTLKWTDHTHTSSKYGKNDICEIKAYQLFFMNGAFDCPLTIHLSFFLLTMGPIIGITITTFLIDRIGRSITMFLYLLIVACACGFLLERFYWVSTLTLATVLFGCHFAAKTIFTMMTIENFPTGVRATGLGLSRCPGLVLCAMAQRLMDLPCSATLSMLLTFTVVCCFVLALYPDRTTRHMEEDEDRRQRNRERPPVEE